MDRLTAFVAIAQLRLRLDIVQRHPHLLEKIEMDKRPPLLIPRPVELAGMRSRLLRAQQQQKDIAVIGKDYDAVDGIDEAKGALKGHVGDLKMYESSVRSTIESMVDRSNGGDPLDGGEKIGQSGQTSHGDGHEKQLVTADEVGKADPVIAEADVGKVEGVIGEPAASWTGQK